MNIFHIAFFAILLLGLNYNFRPSPNRKKWFCIISGTIYFLISALRSKYIGGDTLHYVRMFNTLTTQGIDKALTYYDHDPIFGAFVWLIGRFTDSYTVLFTVVAALFCFSVWYYIYKHSKDPCLSVIFLLAFNLFQFSLTGMRQTIAIAFIIWAIIFLKQDKPIKAALFVVLASMFHLSALIFIIVIPLKLIKLSLNMLYFSILGLIAVFFARSFIAEALIFLVSDRGYSVDDDNAGLTMVFVIFVLYAFCALFSFHYKKDNADHNIDLMVAMIAVFFEMLVPAQTIFFRIAFYFLIINTSLIPNVIHSIRTPIYRQIITVGLYGLLSAQYLFFTMGSCHILPYATFWQ